MRASQGLLSRMLALQKRNEQQRALPLLAALRAQAKSLRCADTSRKWLSPGEAWLKDGL